MNAGYIVISVVVGIVIGAIITRLTAPSVKKQNETKKELDQVRFNLDQQRQELVDHFSNSAEMLDNIAKDYNKLYQHMAKTSSDLLPNLPQQDNPFLLNATQEEATEETETQPKDYANGATGLFKGQDPEVVPAPKAEKKPEMASPAKENTETKKTEEVKAEEKKEPTEQEESTTEKTDSEAPKK